jgi:hypothetical protein
MPTNYLVNFGPLLNIFANFANVGGFIFGVILIIHAAFLGKSEFTIPIFKWKLSRLNQFLVGFILILIALAIPAMVNHCVTGTHCTG